jgi:hypothetical protein|uniref:FCP1 homology domain-containing protein n=1 Tax=viral metagenome TaxID=1070528 RepID=A0A6C0CIJ6_9ZZZZ
MKNKIVVFDVDETLGYFTQLGVFCDCLDEYFNDVNYGNKNFNKILDLCPEFIRPNLFPTLQFLKQKKKNNECYKVMIYTNNQGPQLWVENLKAYFDNKLKFKLFDQIIAAFKVRGQRVELGRTSHDKTIDDFFRCTKLPLDVEICFIDDLFHEKMENDKVYYINVKPYHYELSFSNFLLRFLDSELANNIKNNEEFISQLNSIYTKMRFNYMKKDKKEQEIDEIVGKKLFHHIKQFFYENNNETLKRKINKKKNKSIKKR